MSIRIPISIKNNQSQIKNQKNFKINTPYSTYQVVKWKSPTQVTRRAVARPSPVYFQEASIVHEGVDVTVITTTIITTT